MVDFDESYFKKNLTPEQYKILREAYTEPPFSGKFDDFWKSGVYRCAACKTILFSSKHKYDAGCGWPSFWEAVEDNNIKLEEDLSHGMVRTEVKCGVCGSHLGHLFDDGPSDHGGKRYCINSGALDFKDE